MSPDGAETECRYEPGSVCFLASLDEVKWREGRGERGLYLNSKLALGLRDRPVFSPRSTGEIRHSCNSPVKRCFQTLSECLWRSHVLFKGRPAETLFIVFSSHASYLAKSVHQTLCHHHSQLCVLLPYSWLCMLTRFSSFLRFTSVLCCGGWNWKVHTTLFCWSEMYLRPENHTPQMAKKYIPQYFLLASFYLRIESVHCVLWIILLGTGRSL